MSPIQTVGTILAMACIGFYILYIFFSEEKERSNEHK